MDSFYGGPNGQSFAVKKIFNNKVEMDADLIRGWTSPVQPGEFVIISYGMPNEDKTLTTKSVYEANRDIDLANDGKTYNATLWQKTYDESVVRTSSKGLAYRLLASMTGNTPLINILDTVIENAGATETDSKKVNVWLDYDSTNVDYPQLTFHFPAHYIWTSDVATTTPADGAYVSVTTSGDYDEQLKLTLRVPDSWDIDVDTRTLVAPGVDPNVELADTGSETTKTFHFTIPKAQLFTFNQDETTPYLDAFEPIQVEETPSTASDASDGVIDTRNFIYRLPKSWKLVMQNQYLDATDDPYILNINGADTGSPIDTKTWTLMLPKAWDLRLTSDYVDAENGPVLSDKVDSDEDDDGLIETRTWNLTLPRAWDLQVARDIINPGGIDPYITETIVRGDQDTTTDTKIWTLHIPKAWELEVLKGETLGPTGDPGVREGASDNETKRFLVDLPRAVKFIYGDLMGKPEDYSGIDDNSLIGSDVGDYYVNQKTGCIYYLATKASATAADFTYVACLRAPDPVVTTTGIDPYKAVTDEETGVTTYKPADPTVDQQTITDEDGRQVGWSLELGLPHVPSTITTPSTFVGVDDPGKVEFSRTGTDAAQFNFTIPRGSKIYSGVEITKADDGRFITVVTEDDQGREITIQVEAQNGDIYVNTDSGKVFTWDNDAYFWKIAKGSLKGPVGDSLKKVESYMIATSVPGTEGYDEDYDTTKWQNESDYQSLIKAVIDRYEAKHGEGEVPKDDEVIDVTWKATEGETTLTNYWIHHITGDTSTENPGWKVDLLTGSAGNLFLHEYQPGGDHDRGYDATYINQLIGGLGDINDPVRQTYSEQTFDSIFGWGSWDQNGICYDYKGNEMKYIIPIGTRYFYDVEVTQEVPNVLTTEPYYADQVNYVSGSFEIDGTTYYVRVKDMVTGHLYDDHSTYSAKEIDYLLAWGRFPAMIKS